MAAVALKLPVSVVIPTLNEEANLGGALDSVRWADEVVVIDSGSSDSTASIAEGRDARVVDFRWPGHGPKKKAWALENLELRNEWILLLDADERTPEPLVREIAEVVAAGSADGCYFDREFIFMGRSLRCFRPNWNMRLFRRSAAAMEDLGLHELPGTGDNEIHEHVSVTGTVKFLNEPLLHHDYRGIGDWLDRHNRYATWEAHLYAKFRAEPIGTSPLGFLRLDPFRRKRVLRRIWVRMPCRPLMRFLVWYVFRRGFLDGRQGFVFCLLMAYYELTIGIKTRELRSEAA